MKKYAKNFTEIGNETEARKRAASYTHLLAKLHTERTISNALQRLIADCYYNRALDLVDIAQESQMPSREALILLERARVDMISAMQRYPEVENQTICQENIDEFEIKIIDCGKAFTRVCLEEAKKVVQNAYANIEQKLDEAWDKALESWPLMTGADDLEAIITERNHVTESTSQEPCYPLSAVAPEPKLTPRQTWKKRAAAESYQSSFFPPAASETSKRVKQHDAAERIDIDTGPST